MKNNFYLAAHVQQTENQEIKDYAYIIIAHNTDNVLSVIGKCNGLKALNLCDTKKEAVRIVTCWNDTFKSNGTYMFADGPF